MILTLSARTQNLARLTSDNGYGIYHFGDLLSKFGDSLKFLGSSNPPFSAYEYTLWSWGKRMIDTIRCHHIGFYFNKENQLQYFHYWLYFPNNREDFVALTDRKFNSLKEHFVSLYGNEYTLIPPGETGPGFQWFSGKVMLKLTMFVEKDKKWRRIEIIFSRLTME